MVPWLCGVPEHLEHKRLHLHRFSRRRRRPPAFNWPELAAAGRLVLGRSENLHRPADPRPRQDLSRAAITPTDCADALLCVVMCCGHLEYNNEAQNEFCWEMKNRRVQSQAVFDAGVGGMFSLRGYFALNIQPCD